ncbi:MAG: family 43 glycosylhydrolase [Tannerellaceae bacterium]|jgi:sialate O-acetylesterase|nr:family 43 glycosylhydrolase [Tannerellaceae bacterium]
MNFQQHKHKSLLIVGLALLAGHLSAQNPFITDQFTADPTARVFEGKVYVYPSHDIPSPIARLKEWFCMADYHVFSSENLTDWTDHGVIVSQDKVPWVDADGYQMWAPDCIEKNGKYYFYFPAPVKDTTIAKGSMIGVAVADKPYGPFIPQDMPIKGVHGIDPATFIDKDGQAYIYWAGFGNLMGAKLKDNMLELASDPVAIKDLPTKGLKEGPFVFERNGHYYFTFPWVQNKTEILTYAMGKHPLGPFEMKGTIMDESPTECWTNHHSIIEYKGQWYLFYHHNDLSPHFDKNRSIRVDSLSFNPDGTIQKVIPTLRGVGITDARSKIQLDRYSAIAAKGAGIDFINKANTFEGWMTIFSAKDAWVRYNKVDFGKIRAEKIVARLASPTGGKLVVRVGGLDGKIVAEIDVPKDTVLTRIAAPIASLPKGVHDLFVSLAGEGTVSVDWISFGAEQLLEDVRLPRLVADGMVLQRDQPISLWGWIMPGKEVVVDFNKNKYYGTANGKGEWSIQLPPQKAGGPYSININNRELKNILFGDVWLCAGQSNMETPISRLMILYADEINTYFNPNIRYVKIPTAFNFHGPQTDVPPCTWSDVSPESAQMMSALPYFFAKEMYERTKAPVGLINSSVGGTPAEAWISEASIAAYPAMLNDMRLGQSDEFIARMNMFGGLAGARWNAVLCEQDEGIRQGWASPNIKDSDWKSTDIFDNSWGREGLSPISGVFWFRKEIDLPAEYANRPAMMYMGRIVGADSVFVNGKFAGTTGYQYPPRNYPLGAGMLKAGKNTIAVRLVNSGGFPEFVRDKPYKIVLQDKKEISLTGQWKYRIGAVMPPNFGGGVSFQNKPVGLYNGMIAPLQNHAFKGILWYQGESNTGRPQLYYDLMTALVSDWRKLFRADLPFFIVQLPNYMEPMPYQPNSDWAALREVQRRLSIDIPKAALAVTIDLGEWNDVHPLNKKDVGKRLALQVRRHIYGDKITSEGPMYESHAIEGNKVVISFRAGTDDLKPVEELQGFVVAGSDGQYKPAKARIVGKKVEVWSEDVSQPVSVRYAWANNPSTANLYNSEGLPASPFQSAVK